MNHWINKIGTDIAMWLWIWFAFIEGNKVAQAGFSLLVGMAFAASLYLFYIASKYPERLPTSYLKQNETLWVQRWTIITTTAESLLIAASGWYLIAALYLAGTVFNELGKDLIEAEGE